MATTKSKRWRRCPSNRRNLNVYKRSNRCLIMSEIISRKELIKKFKALGYTGPYSGGRHQLIKKSAKKIRIPNPHKSNDIDIGLVKEILRQAGISNDEWDSACEIVHRKGCGYQQPVL